MGAASLDGGGGRRRAQACGRRGGSGARDRPDDPFRYLVVHLGIPDDMNPPADANAGLAAQRSLVEIAEAAAPLASR